MTGPILLTGFAAFDGVADNPAQAVVLALQGRHIAGRVVVGSVLPVVFGAAGVALRKAMRQHQPSLVLALGVAASRAVFSVEKVALNWRDARVADNAGQRPLDEPALLRGPAAYLSTLPVRSMVLALQAAGQPAELSLSAGSFVCNDLFYALMRATARRPGVRAGFMHLPPMDGVHGQPLDAQVQAVQVALRAAVAQAEGKVARARNALGRID